MRHPGEFLWSSFHRCALGRSDDALTPHPLYEDLAVDSERRLAMYRELFENDIDYRTLHKIRDAVHNGWVLGDAGFLAKIARQALRRPTRVPVGRRKRELTWVESAPVI